MNKTSQTHLGNLGKLNSYLGCNSNPGGKKLQSVCPAVTRDLEMLIAHYKGNEMCPPALPNIHAPLSLC